MITLESSSSGLSAGSQDHSRTDTVPGSFRVFPLWIAHSMTSARLDVGRSQSSLQAQTGLGWDPRVPHHCWWQWWFLPGGFWSRQYPGSHRASRKTSGICPWNVKMQATLVPPCCASEKELAANSPSKEWSRLTWIWNVVSFGYLSVGECLSNCDFCSGIVNVQPLLGEQ